MPPSPAGVHGRLWRSESVRVEAPAALGEFSDLRWVLASQLGSYLLGEGHGAFWKAENAL